VYGKTTKFNESPGWKWYCLVYVEWLLRATHLAVNPGFVWWFSPEGTLVDGHPGIKRFETILV
jgi:hypothetical protein